MQMHRFNEATNPSDLPGMFTLILLRSVLLLRHLLTQLVQLGNLIKEMTSELTRVLRHSNLNKIAFHREIDRYGRADDPTRSGALFPLQLGILVDEGEQLTAASSQ